MCVCLTRGALAVQVSVALALGVGRAGLAVCVCLTRGALAVQFRAYTNGDGAGDNPLLHWRWAAYFPQRQHQTLQRIRHIR